MSLMRYMTMCVLVNTVVSIPFHLLLFHQVKQPPEVVEAYRVCQRFEQLLGKDLDIKQILDRKPPLTAREFVSYASQLDSDVAQFRAHLQRLIRQYPAAAERMRKFSAELLSAKSELPKDFVVRPRHDSYSGNLMAKDEAYYEINGFIVVRESGQMRIVRIRLFTKLF